MTPSASTRNAARVMLGERRDIGPLGTASRVLVGLLAISLPIALAGFGWWDALAAFLVLPLVATLAAWALTVAYRRAAPESLRRDHAVCSAPACWLVAIVVGVAVALGALTPASGDVSFWVWIGASMLLAAARGYAGCEVLAAPNLLSGRRDEIGCIIFNPIDRVEAARAARQPTSRRDAGP